MTITQFSLRINSEKDDKKKLASELWLKREISETKIKKVLNDEEIKDLEFGKILIKEILNEINFRRFFFRKRS